LSQKAYQEGAIALTDVLDADRQLLVAQDQLESTRADAARAAVSTFRALGGGWEAPTRLSLALCVLIRGVSAQRCRDKRSPDLRRMS
jgi:outer membrane protein TolC